MTWRRLAVSQRQTANMSLKRNIFCILLASCHLLAAAAFQSPYNNRPLLLFGSRSQSSKTTAFTVNSFAKGTSTATTRTTVVERYFDAWNRRDVNEAIAYFAQDAVLEDTQFPSPFVGKAAIERHFLLCQEAFPESVQFIVDDTAVSFDGNKIGLKWHIELQGDEIPNSRGCSLYNINAKTGLIDKGYDTMEPTNKVGKLNLEILSAAGKFIETTGINTMRKEDFEKKEDNTVEETTKTPGWMGGLLGKKKQPTTSPKLTTAAERYFDAWSRRDMEAAVNLFADDCQYEDTVFPEPFSGKAKLKAHLLKCASAFPASFGFVVDDVADGGDAVCVLWHAENDGEPLPFTRGCSFYNIDTKTGLILKGFDEVEPAVFKLGYVKLALVSLATNLQAEPIRAVPLLLWVAYMYSVFLSDGILPGANALALEQRTWEEVRDLSLNFFFVSPLLQLPFSPTVHPMLEGVFNLLLSWAALFAGFLSDDRPKKPNMLPMVPIVVGMQFLTSAFLLPYLATRSTERLPENGKIVYSENLDTAGRVVGESRLLGPILGGVGLGSIVWAFVARFDDFGDLHQRCTSFVELLSIDRVGSSFIVDLVIFALFQGWLVNDDMKRRGIQQGEQQFAGLQNLAKFIPFFGLAAYLTLRPSLPSSGENES